MRCASLRCYPSAAAIMRALLSIIANPTQPQRPHTMPPSSRSLAVAPRPYVSPTSYLPNLVGRGNQLPNFACGFAPALFSINGRHLREDESAKDMEIERHMSRLRVIQHFIHTRFGAWAIGSRYLLHVKTTCCSGLSATCEARGLKFDSSYCFAFFPIQPATPLPCE